ncbi:MAG: hypothetical protein H6818_02350 [Phycisphaerales bacterium]|nr:hypothetical protein [Phycisphaerales bacterium]MCB9863155.1 hypothetical protein [Phycisphaerales bacterium]
MMKQLAFTITMALALFVVAAASDTLFNRISDASLDAAGLSMNHISGLQIHRIITSTFLTHGGTVFWRSWIALIIILALCELRIGTARTAGAFWLGHFLTVIAMALVIVPVLRLTTDEAGAIVYTAIDVGPSAGYFTCLGVVVVTISNRRLRAIVSTCIVFALIALSLWRFSSIRESPHVFLADSAHALAFIGGALAARGLRLRTKTPSTGRRS